VTTMPPSSIATNEKSLTVLVMDVSPVQWGKNDMSREVFDKKRKEQNKKGTAGPGILEELLSSASAFSSALLSLERDSALLIVAVAANEVAVVYPRKDHLEEYFANPSESTFDIRLIQRDLLDGVAELIKRAATKEMETRNGDDSISNSNMTRSTPGPDGGENNDSMNDDCVNNPHPTVSLSSSLPAMASGFSIALCLINRFMVAAHAGAGVSALHSHHTWERGNGDDEGIILAMGGTNGNNGGNRHQPLSKAGWSPRILFLQVSDDRPDSFNAMMNCTFAAVKQNVVVDGCFLQNLTKNSPFLQQACDMTGGLYMTPTGASQCGHFLTEILLCVFLSPRSCRNRLKLPGIDEVDFRARAFDTGNIVDQAYVCNQCLSIFEHKAAGFCPTCGAEIKSKKRKA
jgi:transcription initiation factor TFIIH subunit 3